MNELPGPTLFFTSSLFFPSRFFTFFWSVVTSSSVVDILVSACVILSEQSVMSLLAFSIAERMPSNLDEISVFMVLVAASILVKEVTDSSLSVVVVFPSGCFSGLVTGLAIELALLAGSRSCKGSYFGLLCLDPI